MLVPIIDVVHYFIETAVVDNIYSRTQVIIIHPESKLRRNKLQTLNTSHESYHTGLTEYQDLRIFGASFGTTTKQVEEPSPSILFATTTPVFKEKILHSTVGPFLPLDLSISEKKGQEESFCRHTTSIIMPSSRSKKRVKTEDDDTDITTSAQPSDHVLRTVEFKFCSLKTAILPHDGAMTGTLHIPMLQNTKTGRYKVPSGKTEFTGKAKFCDIEFADPDYDVHADVTERKDSCRTGIINKNELEEDFTGSFGRKDADSPIDEFRLGYHLQINTVSDDVAAALIRSDRPMCPRMGESDIRPIGMTREYFPFVEYPSERHLEVGSILRHLDDWEKNAGGYLCVYASAKANPDCMSWQSCDIDEQLRLRHSNTWRADYKIKMYTVLSENSPSDATEIAQVDDGESSGWDVDALVHLMKARFPELGEDWAKRAVKNYRYFIDLKVKSKDWDSKVYSPSKAIDEVWHAHLSFPQQYRQVRDDDD